MTVVRLLSLVVVCAALAGAVGVPAAVAQDPFGPIPQAPPDQPPPPPPPEEDEGGLNRTQELLIGGAGLILLVGIGWAIVRDARSAAPVESDRAGGDDRPKGSRRPPARRVRQSRAKARAARRARKKNR